MSIVHETMSSFPSEEIFKKLTIYFDALGGEGRTLVKDPAVNHVIVIWERESAHDVVYMFAMAGKKVT